MSPGRFGVISRSRPDSVGGGVVAEIFRDLPRPTRFSGGGVRVAEFFPVAAGNNQLIH